MIQPIKTTSNPFKNKNKKYLPFPLNFQLSMKEITNIKMLGPLHIQYNISMIQQSNSQQNIATINSCLTNNHLIEYICINQKCPKKDCRFCDDQNCEQAQFHNNNSCHKLILEEYDELSRKMNNVEGHVKNCIKINDLEMRAALEQYQKREEEKLKKLSPSSLLKKLIRKLQNKNNIISSSKIRDCLSHLQNYDDKLSSDYLFDAYRKYQKQMSEIKKHIFATKQRFIAKLLDYDNQFKLPEDQDNQDNQPRLPTFSNHENGTKMIPERENRDRNHSRSRSKSPKPPSNKQNQESISGDIYKTLGKQRREIPRLMSGLNDPIWTNLFCPNLVYGITFPIDFKLVFKASQYQFSCQAFHNICNDIQNTLTIIKYSNQCIFAGFTPLKWKSPLLSQGKPSLPTPVEQQKLCDQNWRSKLFDVKKQRVFELRYLQDGKNKAIIANQNYGPFFGVDLRIGDKGSFSTLNIGTNDSSSYCSKSYKNQILKKQFNETINQLRPKIKQYEVYQIEFK